MKDTLSKLLDKTIMEVRHVLRRYGNPAVMSSFGKDSLVMLHVLREAGFNLPIIYFKDPWSPHKHIHAETMIAKLGATVHNWPPMKMGVKFNGELLEFVGRYNFSSEDSQPAVIDIPKNIQPQKPRQQLLCGLFDIIRRPISAARHPWDIILLGHKSSDVDQYYGEVPLHLDLRIGADGHPSLYFPIRHWNDDDVWDLIEDQHIDYQKSRYENRQELDDKTFSNDYIQCCSKCLDPRNGEFVDCPKFGRRINNQYENVPHLDAKLEYFGQVEEEGTPE